MSKTGHQIKTPDDLAKDPYVFEFLGLSEQGLFKESELENRLLNKLQQFLLELVKGFAFIGRQYRVTLNNRHFSGRFGFLSPYLEVLCFDRFEGR